MKYLILASLFFVGCEPLYNASVDLYSSRVQNLQKEAAVAFDEAEKKIFPNNPTPDDKPPGVDEDPKKCICKGTGIIVHSDGHKTTCPFHHKQ